MPYNPYLQYQGYNPYPPQMPPQMTPQQITPSQANGFISVRSIDEALAWPIAPGNSLTFKDESAPYIYTKTKGFSQLEQPIFEKYRLVKEEEAIQPVSAPQTAFNAENQIKLLWEEVEALKAAQESLKAKPRRPQKKEEETDDAQ